MAQENLKKAISAIDAIAEQAEKSFADGVQGKDFYAFVPQALAAGQVDWKAAIQEAKNRTEAGNQELLDFVKTDFDLTDDAAEKKVESVIAALLALDDVAIAFKKAA